MRAFVVAGTHSGCGKTIVALGLLAALQKKGLKVQPFKAGPDFIDAGLHRVACGSMSRNLDLWMCGEAYVRHAFLRHGSEADISVVEGVMGLYDGQLSTAKLAAVLDVPVVLVVDGYGMAESAGAVVRGFREMGASMAGGGIMLKGVIFNRVASEHHYARLAEGLADVRALGYLPRDLQFEIPHRHLGLVVAEEQPVSDEALGRLADAVLTHVKVDALVDLAGETKCPIGPISPIRPIGLREAKGTVRIAVASDRAFCFYYHDNMELLQEAGAEIVFFSPLSDERLPTSVDAVYLGGGYPELYAGQLSRNLSMRAAIREWAEAGRPLYAECGGLMYLSKEIRAFDGQPFPMAGVFPFRMVMTGKRAHLGYREVQLREATILGGRGQVARGHEFHYSEIVEGETGQAEKVYDMRNGMGSTLAPEGYVYGNTLASYVHLHFGSNRSIAPAFVYFAGKGRV